MASPTHLMPEYGRYEGEKPPSSSFSPFSSPPLTPSLTKPGGLQRVEAPLVVAYSHVGAWSGLDCTCLARDEASGASCGKECTQRSPEELPLPRPDDCSRRRCIKAASVGHGVPSQLQRAVDEPGQEFARQPKNTKTGSVGKHVHGRARRAACKAGDGVGRDPGRPPSVTQHLRA